MEMIGPCMELLIVEKEKEKEFLDWTLNVVVSVYIEYWNQLGNEAGYITV